MDRTNHNLLHVKSQLVMGGAHRQKSHHSRLPWPGST